MTTVAMIACVGANNEIGKDNKLLIKNREDLSWLRKHTMGKAVIMGRLTYESIGTPLKGRVNVVLTRDIDYKPHPHVLVRHSIKEVLHEYRNESEIVIIGGSDIYSQFMPIADKLYITRVHKEFPNADSFFPRIPTDFKEYFFYESNHGSTPMTFHVYRKTNT